MLAYHTGIPPEDILSMPYRYVEGMLEYHQKLYGGE